MRVLLILLISCATTAKAQVWNLVWSDEFNGSSLNTQYWSHDRGNGHVFGLTGWGNGELQYYQEQNTTLANGVLRIEAREEPQGIADEYSDNIPYYYSSSKITTRNKFEILYGKVEARMKTMDGQGMWPAFWMLPGGCWPETGEIDIMEQWGNDGPTNVTTGAAHMGNCGEGSTYTSSAYTLPSGSYGDDYHIYSIEWYQDYIAWFVDGQLFHSITPSSYPSHLTWPYNSHDWYLIFNLAITSSGPNANTIFPNDIEIDYVRVYELDETAIPQVTFRVDMSEEDLEPTDIVYVNGTFNDWCGDCNPLSPIGDGLWEADIALAPGQIEYKYTTNGWTGLIEEFAPETECCLTTYTPEATYVNRVAQIGAQDLLLDLVCFNSCESCNPVLPGCTDPSAVNFDPAAQVNDGSCEYPVTFLLDMQGYGATFTTPEVNGTFNDWCGASCAPMSDAAGDGLWATTLTLPQGFYEFKFAVDDWADQEYFSDGESCTLTTGDFVNRRLDVNGPMSYGPVCWASCEDCPSDCVSFSTAPTDLTKSFDPVAGQQDRVQLKWYKDSPQVRYSDEDAAMCDIKFWPKRDLNPLSAEPIGAPYVAPDTTYLWDRSKTYPDGSPREIFKWPVKYRADGANNANRLSPNIRYQWQVRCECGHEGSGPESPWSVIRFFNTPDFDPATGMMSAQGGVSKSLAPGEGPVIAPNPLLGRALLIRGLDSKGDYHLELYDASARPVWSFELDGQSAREGIQLPQQLSEGLYILSIMGAKERHTLPIVLR